MISFARGAPAPECLNIEEVADCARAALEQDGVGILSYGPGGGYGPLRERLAAWHEVEPGRVVITSGSLQGFGFLAEQLVKPGTRVLVEAPTYDRPLKILKRLGAEIVGVPMDDEGLIPDELPEGDFAFLYTIPTFQNPSGRTLSVERRKRLAELAGERGLLVLEDDPYGLVRYDGEPLPSVFELAGGGEQIVYCSSFSKTVAPGLRVGWYVLPEQLGAEIEALAVSTYISPPYLTQAAVCELLRRQTFLPNVERINGLLRARRDAMLDALAREMPDDATWTRPAGGYFVWLDLPSGPPSTELLVEAEAAGVTFVKGTDFFADGSGERSLRLAFSFVTPDEIADGVARLGALVRAATPAAL